MENWIPTIERHKYLTSCIYPPPAALLALEADIAARAADRKKKEEAEEAARTGKVVISQPVALEKRDDIGHSIQIDNKKNLDGTP